MSYDAEKVLADYLRAAIGTRVVAVPPDNRDLAWVYLTEQDAPQDPKSPVDWHVHHYFQVDCYAGEAGGPPEANRIGGEVRDAVAGIRNVQTDGVVMTFGRVEGGHRDQDPDLVPARDRRVLTVTVGMHP